MTSTMTTAWQYPVQQPPSQLERPPPQANKPAATALASRTYHLKSRAGCYTCKRRHVRCDEVQPTCSACQRLLLGCEYPAVKSAAKNKDKAQQAMQGVLFASSASSSSSTQTGRAAKGAQKRGSTKAAATAAGARCPRLTLHLWTPEDSARAIVHSAFSELDPVGMARSDFFGVMLARESVHRDCYRYLCLVIRDLSFSSQADWATRIAGFRPLSDVERWMRAIKGGARTGSGQRTSSSSLPRSDDEAPSSLPDITTDTQKHVCKGDNSPGAVPRPSTAQKHVVSAVGNYARALSSFRDSLPSMCPRDVLYATMCFSIIEMMQGNYASRDVIVSAGVALLRPHVAAPKLPRDDGSTRYGLHTRYADSLSLCNTEAVSIRFAAANVFGGMAGPPTVSGAATPADVSEMSGGATRKARQRLIPEFRLPLTFPVAQGLDSLDVLRGKWRVFHGTLECWLLSRYWAVAVGQRLDSAQHLADHRRLLGLLGAWRAGLRECIVMRETLSMSNGDTEDEDEVDTLSILDVYLHCLQIAMTTIHDVPKESSPSVYCHTCPAFEPLGMPSLLRLARRTTREVSSFRISNFIDLFYDATMLPVISRQAVIATTSPDGGQQADLEIRHEELSEAQLNTLNIFHDVVRCTFEAQEEALRTPESRGSQTAITNIGGEAHDESSDASLPSFSSSSPSSSSSSYASTSSRDSYSAPASTHRDGATPHPRSCEALGDHHHHYRTDAQTRPQVRQHRRPRPIPTITSDFAFMPLSARKELTLLCVPMQIAIATAALRGGVFRAQVVS